LVYKGTTINLSGLQTILCAISKLYWLKQQHNICVCAVRSSGAFDQFSLSAFAINSLNAESISTLVARSKKLARPIAHARKPNVGAPNWCMVKRLQSKYCDTRRPQIFAFGHLALRTRACKSENAKETHFYSARFAMSGAQRTCAINHRLRA
jgi:hypothetical protein